jgi:hypothetical protein
LRTRSSFGDVPETVVLWLPCSNLPSSNYLKYSAYLCDKLVIVVQQQHSYKNHINTDVNSALLVARIGRRTKLL